ncbi:MAG: DNA internalization-related competence protein ComEC/Rec2 [Clostridium sp.]
MKRSNILVIGLVFLMLGGVFVNIYRVGYDARVYALQDKKEFEGRVVDLKETSFTLKNNKNNYKIVFYYDAKKIKEVPSIGDYIQIKGKLKENKEYRKNSMASRGLLSYGKVTKIISIDRNISIFNIHLKIKDKISRGFESVDSRAGAFVSGIVTGYRSGIDEEDMKSFSEMDIIHIVAVSGFNLAILYAATMTITTMLPIKRRLIIALVVSTCYVFITGFEPSVTRALIMIYMVILARYLGKINSTVNGLFIAGFLMLTINPFYIYSLGFILSFAATLSISLFSSDLLEHIEGYSKLFKNEIAATGASMILTLPIILYSKGYYSLISIVVNVVISPLVGLITVTGFISCFLYVIIPYNLILYPCVFIGEITLYIIGLFDSINVLVFTGRLSIVCIVLYYFIVLLYLKIIKFKKNSIKYIIISSMVGIIVLSSIIDRQSLKIHFIDVGQGDSIFIEYPGKKTMLIDTGNAFDDYIAAKSKVMPYIRKLGYNEIDYLVISHFHSDHNGGVDYIEGNHSIGKKISYLGCSDESYLGLMEDDYMNISGARLSVLSPNGRVNYDDENKNSLIFELSYKDFNALFTGDATNEEMDKISGNYDLFKVPHHGSKYSISEKMLNLSTIKNAVITVGENNYNHPAKECINTLEDEEANIYRTDKMGNVVYIIDLFGARIGFNN